MCPNHFQKLHTKKTGITRFALDAAFQGVNRLFVLAFEDTRENEAADAAFRIIVIIIDIITPIIIAIELNLIVIVIIAILIFITIKIILVIIVVIITFNLNLLLL